jgi:transcriptional regulator with XRE-family HTH domain
MHTTGMDLRLRRVAAGVTMKTVAFRMGTTRQTVWRYESLAIVPPEIVTRYVAALTSENVRIQRRAS